MRSLIFTAALVLSGCTVVEHHTYVGGGVPTGAPTSRILDGAGINVVLGQMAGYFITGNTGGSFRIVWTGDGPRTYREFFGSAWTSGSFDSLHPGCTDGSCPLSSGDFISGAIPVAGGQRIDWDTFASTTINGFDFTATQDPVYFDLFVDGVHDTSLVVFTDASTGQLATAPSLPFGLTTR